MTERPILFSAPMVRALLDGSKMQTRRVVKDLPAWEITEICHDAACTGKWMPNGPAPSGRGMAAGHWRLCPHGQAGDRLWVRETFIAFGRWETRYSAKKGRDEWHFVDMTVECDRVYQHAASAPDVPLATGRGGMLGWWKRPGIFMPRAACRIVLDVVAIRAERLNDISEADAVAEGWPRRPEVSDDPHVHADVARDWYIDLWGQINGAGSWSTNPWVWAIEFKRVTS